jgi:hypothetical protein
MATRNVWAHKTSLTLPLLYGSSSTRTGMSAGHVFVLGISICLYQRFFYWNFENDLTVWVFILLF